MHCLVGPVPDRRNPDLIAAWRLAQPLTPDNGWVDPSLLNSLRNPPHLFASFFLDSYQQMF
jgi:hypothetical protein